MNEHSLKLPTETVQSLTKDGVRYLTPPKMVILSVLKLCLVGEQCHKIDDLFFQSDLLLGWLFDILENLA